MNAEDAALRSVLLLTSGPTGGVTGSRYLAQAMGHANVITSDMGGTSFDVSLIIDGRPTISATTEVARYHIATPMIDITTVGAGGGSVVTVNDGLIRVGPESAGAHPGPVCYGRGGRLVTVTDADLVLGVIDPDRFLGGRMRLDLNAAEQAIEEQVAGPLGLSVEEAAAGIRRIVDSNMANTLREVTIGRGHDPREFVLYAYGGAGPTHSAGYGRELGVRQILIPATSPVHSAYGALASDLLYSAERSLPMASRASGEDFDASLMEDVFQELENQCQGMLAAYGLAPADCGLGRFVDMRYRMQTHELIIPVPEESIDTSALTALATRFERTYEETYGQDSGYSVAGIEIETFRVEAVGRTRKPSLPSIPKRPAPVVRERLIYDLTSGARIPHKVVEWAELPAWQIVEGPAVIEHPTTTVYVAQRQSAQVDGFGNLVIEETARRNGEPSRAGSPSEQDRAEEMAAR
jgi:N-methylhydantoinase A